MQGPFPFTSDPGIVSVGLEQFQEKCVAVFPGKAPSAFPRELRKNKNV